MLPRLNRALALVLAAAILSAASGFGPAANAAMEHELGIESSMTALPSDDDESARKCGHGCAGHLGVHLITLTDARPLPVMTRSCARQDPATAAGAMASRPDSFFRPPRTSLA